MVVIKVLSFTSNCEWNNIKFFEEKDQILGGLFHRLISPYLDYFEIKDSQIIKVFALLQAYISSLTLEQYLTLGVNFAKV